MMDNASLEDSVIVGDRLAQITAAFEALQRNAATRRRALEHGLAQASEGKTFEIQSGLGIGLIPRLLPLKTCLVPGYSQILSYSHGEKLRKFFFRVWE